MKVSNFTDFLKKNNLKSDTMNEKELQRVYNYPTYPIYTKIYSHRGFVNIDNGCQAVNLTSLNVFYS